MSDTRELAPPYLVRGFEGSLGEYLQHLEWMYRAIVGDAGIRLFGLPVRAGGARAPDGRPRLFWHLITGHGAASKDDRELDVVRAALLPRVWDLLERLAAGDPRACWWPESKDRRGFLHVASVDFDLHVVLKVARDGRLLILLTAHPIERPKHRAVLMERAARSRSADNSREPFAHAAWRRQLAHPHRWPATRHRDPVA